MANIITQSEYEKRFGVKPFVASPTEDVVDTKPTPVILTQSEWRKMNNPQKPMGDYLQMGTNLNASVGRAGRGIIDTVKNPDLNTADKFVVGGGYGIRGISDFLGDAFVGLAKLALPKAAEERIKNTLGKEIQDALSQENRDDFLNRMRNPEGGILVGQEANQKISDSIFSKTDDISDRRANDPRYKELTDAAGNFALGAADLVGAGRVQSAADDVIEAGVKASDGVIPKFSEVLDSKTQTRRQQELYNIENNYAKLRKNNQYSSDANASSRARIADAPIWDNVVDTDGKMTTMGKGGAYEQYQRATIDGKESIVRDNLVREGATVNINELARALKTNIFDSGLEGSALERALKGVTAEIKGLSRRADEFGNVPLQNVQDFKTSATKNINYLTDNTPTITLKKTKARTYKEVIENKSKVEVEVDGKKYSVKGINAELAKYMKDLELIKSLDGRRVKGGKLGKYFAQVSGNLIGGAAGSAVGGPLGMAAGTVLGGEAAGLIKGRSMAGTLGKGGKAIPSNPVLDAARREAGLPPVKDLKTPDKPVGAPKGVPKTKEITKVEGQIKNNVKQQNKAIKAGNFGLVSELKEVYAYLVIQLKEMVKAAREGVKSQGGFASLNGEAPDARKQAIKQAEEVAKSSGKTLKMSDEARDGVQMALKDVEMSQMQSKGGRAGGSTIELDDIDELDRLKAGMETPDGLTDADFIEAQALLEKYDIPYEGKADVSSNQSVNGAVTEGMKTQTIVNIGLDIPGGGKLKPKEVEDALKKIGVKIEQSEIKKSNTEDTVVASLSRPLTPDEADIISRELKQEAIVQKVGEEAGELYGPQAEKWGPFNEEYFLNFTERTGQQNAEFFTGKAEKASSDVPYEPVIETPQVSNDVREAFDVYTMGGNFTGHIAKMIPAFAEKQMAVTNAIAKSSARSFLDIGASEGGVVKTVSDVNPKIKSVALDPNPQMYANYLDTHGVRKTEYKVEALGGKRNEE